MSIWLCFIPTKKWKLTIRVFLREKHLRNWLVPPLLIWPHLPLHAILFPFTLGNIYFPYMYFYSGFTKGYSLSFSDMNATKILQNDELLSSSLGKSSGKEGKLLTFAILPFYSFAILPVFGFFSHYIVSGKWKLGDFVIIFVMISGASISIILFGITKVLKAITLRCHMNDIPTCNDEKQLPDLLSFKRTLSTPINFEGWGCLKIMCVAFKNMLQILIFVKCVFIHPVS